MASARIEQRKETRTTTRAKRDYGYPKDENASPKSQRNLRTNEAKGKRTGNTARDEQSKAYIKLERPKKALRSDQNFISKKVNSSPERRVEQDARENKISTGHKQVLGKKSEQESNRLSVSKLANIFDAAIANETLNASSTYKGEKLRPKSATTIRPHMFENESTVSRWSVPSYVKKVSPDSQNYKIYVTEGIAAMRAKFEKDSNENVSVSVKKFSPKLSDLVPDLEFAEGRSRTRSDPGMRPLSSRKYKLRSQSMIDALNCEVPLAVHEYGWSYDDTAINKPRSNKRLSKSNSVDVLDIRSLEPGQNMVPEKCEESSASSTVQSAVVCNSDNSDINRETPDTRDDSTSRSSESRIDSGISSSLESSIENEVVSEVENQFEKHVTKSEKEQDDGLQYKKRDLRTARPFDDEPGKVREASWKDEEEPPEEPEDPTPVFTQPRLKTEKSDTEVDRDLIKNGDMVEKEGEAHDDDVEASSGEESTGSIIEHSSPEADTHDISPVSFLFEKKPTVSAISHGEKKQPRNVGFTKEKPVVCDTYSAEEYDRGNDGIDPVTASAEWELEKRVEKMDVFSVDLEKDEKGLGLSIIGLGVGTDTGVEKLGIFVKSLTEGGTAERDGRIQVNDQIIEVDGTSLVGVTQMFAAVTLKNTSGIVRFLMGREKSRVHAPVRAVSQNSLHQTREVEELRSKLAKEEQRARRAEDRLKELEVMQSMGISHDGITQEMESDTRKLEKMLLEMADRAKSAETDLAIAEAENVDFLKQLEESKGMYLLLEKKFHATKNKIKEYEQNEKTNQETTNVKLVMSLRNRVTDLEQQLEQSNEASIQLVKNSGHVNGMATEKGDEELPQERYFSLEADKFERMAAGKDSEYGFDLSSVPATELLSSQYYLEKKRLAEAQGKKHKPTRASWGCSLESIDMFSGQEGPDDDDDDDDKSSHHYQDEDTDLSKPFGHGFALPGFPLGGFKLKPTGKNIKSLEISGAPPSPETRSSFPLAEKDRPQNVVVENLLEKQLSKMNTKVTSLPSALDQEEGRLVRPNEDPDECLSASTNSLDDIEEATRRIESDLASSQASSRGSSPFLPPAMPLLQMKTVPVQTYNEVAVDVPPEMLTDSESGSTVQSPVELLRFSPIFDTHSAGSGSARSPTHWLTRPVQEWDCQQVGMWLTGLELEEYVIEFANRSIDGKQLLSLDNSKLKTIGINQNDRNQLKKRIKELKSEMEKEEKAKKQKEKEQKANKKDGKSKDKLEKLGFIKKGKYTVTH